MKRLLSLSLVLMVLWLLLSGHYNALLIGLGVVSVLVSVGLARRMDVVDDEGHPVHLTFRAPLYWTYLGWEIIKANIDVARRILSRRPDIDPVLVTLHLPLPWYPAAALAPARPGTTLVPVSASQTATAPPGAVLAPPVQNGVALPPGTAAKRRFALVLGRICPEKGVDDALEAARQARAPLLVAGSVFPYPEHQAFFAEAVAPLLGFRRRWLGPVAGRRKQALLAAARCVLIPSKARETSSLVAMEALAAGTPVIAYPNGALPDIVAHGRTGLLADGVAGLVAALGRVDAIDPAACRASARRRFSAGRMIEAYLARYADLAGA